MPPRTVNTLSTRTNQTRSFESLQLGKWQQLFYCLWLLAISFKVSRHLDSVSLEPQPGKCDGPTLLWLIVRFFVASRSIIWWSRFTTFYSPHLGLGMWCDVINEWLKFSIRCRCMCFEIESSLRISSNTRFWTLASRHWPSHPTFVKWRKHWWSTTSRRRTNSLCFATTQPQMTQVGISWVIIHLLNPT